MPISFATVIDYARTPGRTNVPLAVRLSNASVDRVIAVGSPVYSAGMPGGYERASIPLAVPLPSSEPEVQAFTDTIIYDTSSMDVCWQGQMEQPGKGGLVFDLTARGGISHADDRDAPYVPVDSRLDPWGRSSYNTRSSETAQSGEDTPELELKAPRGTVATTSFIADMVNRTVREAGMKLARFRVTWDTGITDGDWQPALVVRTGGGGGTTVASAAANVAGGTFAARLTTDGGLIPAGSDVANVRFNRNTSSDTVGNDDTWAAFSEVVLRAVLMTAAGVEITTGYAVSTCTVQEIVADLLGRFLPLYDGPNAVIGSTAVTVDQMAYVDGTTPRAVLDDLLKILGDWYYAVWEWTAAGKWLFECQPYPTAVAADLRAADDQFVPPSGFDPINRVAVRWTDGRGRVRTTVVTGTVPGLTRTRERRVDLGDAIGSAALAALAGQVELDRSQAPTQGGRCVVSRQIVDLTTGRLLPPHLLPRHLTGKLVRLDIPPPSFTAADTRNGINIFRVAHAEFDASSNSCTLDLDVNSRLSARQAKLERDLQGRRRR